MVKEALVPLSVPSLIVGIGGTVFSDVAEASPSVAEGDAAFLFRRRNQRPEPWLIAPEGMASGALQHSLRDRSIGWVQPYGHGFTSIASVGLSAPTAIGNLSGRIRDGVGSGNYVTRARRAGYRSNATAGSFAGLRSTDQIMMMGTAAGQGGFFTTVTFACSDAATVAGARQFVGITNAANAPTNVEPSTILSVFGVGHGASDTNLFIYCNGGTTAQPPIDLGPNFPANTLSADAYRLTLYSPPGTAFTIHWTVERLDTPYIASGVHVGTGSSNSFVTHILTPLWAWRTNNATALAVGLDIMRVYFEAAD